MSGTEGQAEWIEGPVSEDFKVGDRVIWRSFPSRGVGVIESVAAWWVRYPGGAAVQRYPDDLELAPPEPPSLLEAVEAMAEYVKAYPYGLPFGYQLADWWRAVTDAAERERAKQ